jgi:multidrug efflux pump subunit AcrA (membrane-fusion protein)
VTLRNLTKGEFLDAGKQVLRVTDLRSLWVVGQLTEADVSEIKLGTQGEIALQTGGEVIGSGRVTYISPALNPSTRTAQVRVTVPNTGKRLKLGSYVRILFESDESKTRVVPSIPSGAVQLLKGNPVVFIPKENIGDFEVRVVRIGSAVKGKVPVLDGLELSEKVVDTGSFLLRAEYLKRNVN